MSKSVEAFRTIGEVADELDVPKHVLRFWEGKFPHIRPMKRGGGRRYYRPEDMELLRGIRHLLHAEGYTIKGVQKILREQGIEQVKEAAAANAVMAAEAQSAKARGRSLRKRAANGASSEAALPPLANAGGRTGDAVLAANDDTSSREGKPPIAAKSSGKQAAIANAIRELETCLEILAAASGGQTATTARPAAKLRASRS